MPVLELKSQGPEVFRFYDFMQKYAASYAFLLGKRDGYFGADEKRFVEELQKRLHIVVDGKFGDRTAAAVGYRWGGTSAPPVVVARRKIWMWTFPGSGANYDQGPSFQLGEMVKNVLKLNHQPVYFQKGGYLGFLGGDSKFSYVEVTYDLYKSLLWLWDNNADVQEAMSQAKDVATRLFPGIDHNALSDTSLMQIAKEIEFEGHLSGYSQSADGVEDALELLCGDGGFVHPGNPHQLESDPGEYRLIRHCIKRVVQFGNPATENTGIANKRRPAWLKPKIKNVNYENDFYANAPDEIRRRMYAIIIKAEMELPFFIRVMKIAIKVLTPVINVFGGILGPLGPIMVAGMAGISALSGVLGGFMSQAANARDEEVDRQIEEMFSITGLITNIPAMFALLGALPGLQAHGGYEFDPVMMDKAYQIIASFRR
jgi:hypothetical protein